MATETIVSEPRQALDVEPVEIEMRQVPARIVGRDLDAPQSDQAEPPRPVGRAQSPSAAAEDQLQVVLSIVRFSPTCGALFGALATAQGEFTDVERTLKAKIESTRAKYEYAYAPLDEVLSAVRPALSKNGLAIMQFPFTSRGALTVRTMLGHSSGEWMENDLAIGMASSDPQSLGSAITYLRRYALMSNLGVAPAYDDDGQAAVAAQQRQGTPQAGQRKSQAAPSPQAPIPQSASAPVVPSVDQSIGTVDTLDDVDNGAAVVIRAHGVQPCRRRPRTPRCKKK